MLGGQEEGSREGNVYAVKAREGAEKNGMRVEERESSCKEESRKWRIHAMILQ